MGGLDNLRRSESRSAGLGRDASNASLEFTRHAPPPLVVRVYDGGAMPARTPGQFLGRVLSLGGGAAEGGPADAAEDGSGHVVFTCLGDPPSVGDVVLVRRYRGRWWARKRGASNPPPPGKLCVSVRGCPDPGHAGFSAVPVYYFTVKLGGVTVKTGSVLTGSSACFTMASGTYDVTVTNNYGLTETKSVVVTAAGGAVGFFEVDYVCFRSLGCSGPLAGVDWELFSGGTPVYTGTTGTSGVLCFYPATVLRGATLEARATYLGRTVTAQPGTCAFSQDWVTRLCACVRDSCGGGPLPGASVSYYSAGHDLGTCTTDADGYCCVDPLAFGVPSGGPSPPETATISATFPDHTPASVDVEAGCKLPYAGGLAYGPDKCIIIYGGIYGYVNGSLTLVPAGGRCCGICGPRDGGYAPGQTTPAVLHADDGFGDVPLTATPDPSGQCVWTGCAMRTAAVAYEWVPPALGGPRCVAHAYVPVPVFFTLVGDALYLYVPVVSVCNGPEFGRACDDGVTGTGARAAVPRTDLASCSPYDATYSKPLTSVDEEVGLGRVYGGSVTVLVTE